MAEDDFGNKIDLNNPRKNFTIILQKVLTKKQYDIMY